MRSSSPHSCYMPAYLILLYFIIRILLDEDYKYEAPRYAVLSTLSSPHPPSVQISSSAPCPQTLSVYVPPLMSETKFHTIQNHRQNYSLVNSTNICANCDGELRISSSQFNHFPPKRSSDERNERRNVCFAIPELNSDKPISTSSPHQSITQATSIMVTGTQSPNHPDPSLLTLPATNSNTAQEVGGRKQLSPITSS
jgi:hypothetical protein